ncbi:MAG: hypothetical protein ACWGQW_03705, partial [bacterium]
KLVNHFKGSSIAGFDIAADEAGYPIDNHISAFHYAYDNHIPCTAHAGEARGPDSIRETIENFRPSRIGHGVRCIEDPLLIEELKQKARGNVASWDVLDDFPQIVDAAEKLREVLLYHVEQAKGK